MIQSNCLYCGKELESPYKFAYIYCPGTDHKSLDKPEDPKMITCLQCKYKWKPRKSSGPPPYCPRCKSYNYGKEFFKNTDVDYEICHKCGGQKKSSNLVCRSCAQPNTNITHYCGIPKKYYKSFMDFVEEYAGNEKDVLDLRYRLFGNIEIKEEGQLASIPIEDKPAKTLEIIKDSIPIEKILSIEEVMTKNVEEDLTGIDALNALSELDWGSNTDLVGEKSPADDVKEI